MNNNPTPRSGLIAPVKSLSSREARLEPFSWYQTMREHSPVAFDEERDCWDVFHYADVQKILQDHSTFSSDRSRFLTGAPIPPNILSMDPPRHTQLRALVTQAFTPKAIASLTPRITTITHELLDNIIEQGEMDVVHDLAFPLPVIVIAEMLGVPSEDRDRFKHWSDVLVKGTAETTDAAIQELRQEKFVILMELAQYFNQILAERRQNPQNDLMTALIHAEIEGEHLNTEDIVSFCILLLAAGNETTTNLITNAIRCFTGEPCVMEQLRDKPALINIAIEEVLRFRSPVQATNRFATKDVELGGHTIKQGQQVVAWIGSANRDERKFTDAAAFVVDRHPNPHLAFGLGIHFCLGAPLARLEAQIALSAMLDRLSGIETTDDELEPIQSSFVYGVKKLPIRFTASGRS